MLRLICLLLFSWCCLPPVRAQVPPAGQAYIDSLQTLVKRSASDSARARIHFLLSEHYAATDSLRSAQQLELALRAGGKYPFIAALHPYYAARLLYRSDADHAEELFLKTDTLLTPFKTKEAYLFRSKTWHSYGVLRQMKDDQKGFADVILNHCIPLAQQAGDSLYLGKNYLDLGIVLKNTGQYDKAETYCLSAIRTLKNAKAPIEQMVEAYYTIAENYIFSGKYPPARQMLDSMKVLLEDRPESPEMLSYYTAESMYFTVQNQFGKSLESLEKGIALARKIGTRYEEQSLLLQKFYALFNSNNFAEALKVVSYLEAQPEMMSQVSNRLQIYFGMAETYAGLGNMRSAYEWMKRYSMLSDSTNASRLKNDIHELEIKYKNAESQKEILALKAKNEQAALSARNTRLTAGLLGAASLFLLVVAVLSVFYYRNSRKLSAQKEINYQQQLREMEQQQQLAVTHAMLEGEERERRRVARDLHDGLGGMLAGIRIRLSGENADQDTGGHANLDKIILQLDHSVHELRRIARNMMPESLLKFGLETALKDLCESLMTRETVVDFQAFDIDKKMPIQAQVTIYRIVQEALSNAIRHARASAVMLQCSQNGNTFFITVEDNGQGFDVEAATQQPGIGLSNIRNRVEYLKGKMELTSAVGEGTTLDIELNVER